MKKNNVLYVCFYQKNLLTCPSISYQMLNQTSGIELLNLSMYGNSEQINLYKSYFEQYSNIYFGKSDAKSRLIDVLCINKYSHIVFLDNECLYNINFHNDILQCISSNIQIMYSIDKSKHIQIFTKKDIITKTIYELIFTEPNFENFYISSNFDRLVKSNNVFYEDGFCIFSKIIHNIQKLKYLDSHIYLNKRNNKVYNIENNIIGNIKEHTLDTLTVEWVLDSMNRTENLLYVKQHIDNTFVHI